MYLMHHGIEGQKWGVRNGPPYPLNNSQKSYREKKIDLDKKGMSDDAESLLIQYAAYSVVLLSAYAISEGKKAVRNKKLNEAMKKRLDEVRSDRNIDKETGLHLKSKNDKSDDIKAVNPKYSEEDNAGATMNCVRCTFAYELRKRGYDVSAKLSTEPIHGLNVTKKVFKNVKNVDINRKPNNQHELEVMSKKAISEKGNVELANKTVDYLSKENNSRGQILVSWPYGGGHSMAYSVSNGFVTIIDAQSGKTYSGKDALDLLGRSIYTQVQRLDNLEFNSKEVKKYVL